MTRKDYVAIAKVLNNCIHHHECDPETVVMVAQEMSTMLKRDNDMFDYRRFMDACTAPTV
jgi:hypothetical protein